MYSNFGLASSNYRLPSVAINQEIAIIKVVLITIKMNETIADGMQRQRGSSVTTGVESKKKVMR